MVSFPAMGTVAVVSLKGGTGKTTTAIYLAASAVAAGASVTLADTDPQGTVGRWVDGLDPPFETVHVTTHRVSDALADMADPDRVLIVDTPPGERDQTITAAVIASSDLVVIPCAPNGTDVDRLSATLTVTAALGTPAAVLIVRTDPRWKAHKDLVAILDADDELIRWPTCIPSRRAIADAYRTIPRSSELHGYEQVWADIHRTLGALNGR